METWLKAALDYLPRWLDYQMRASEQPGCAMAVAYKGRVVREQAFGYANLANRRKMTPRHRFRVASHSKSFTSAGVLKLREQDRLRLDDRVGQYVTGLDPDVAQATLSQLLSHSAGLIRDGLDAGQWDDRRPFLNERELRQALALPPVLDSSARFKYSNHGFGLLGLVIEAVTGEPYRRWIEREVVAASKLTETQADAPLKRGIPFVSGHSGKVLLGRRVAIPGDNVTDALAAATGFISTAADLARFFASLDPAASASVLTPASRREMVRRQWHDPYAAAPMFYGLGTMISKVGNWDVFGHGGGFQSTISRTMVAPGHDLCVSILTNAVDGLANSWAEGAIRILQTYAKGGAPLARTRDWQGRWWNLWETVDLLPLRDHVLVAVPGQLNPLLIADEIEVTGRDRGRIRRAGGFASHGEGAHLVRGRDGRVREVWLGGTRFLPEARMAAEMKRRYDP